MASARLRAAAAQEVAVLRGSSAPAPALRALRDSLVGSSARKAAHAASLPGALAEGLQRGWPAEHVAAVLELIADSAPPNALAPLAPPLLALLHNASPPVLASLSRALTAMLPRLDPASLVAAAAHISPLVARMSVLLQTVSLNTEEQESAARVALVAAFLVASVPTEEAVSCSLLTMVVQMALNSPPPVLALSLRALVALLTAENAPPISPTLLAPLWPRLIPLLRSPHAELQLLASACLASAGFVSDRSRALIALLRLCSHPLRRLRASAALLAAAAVRGNPSQQTFAAVEAGALLRIETLLSSGPDEESAALTLLAELCSLSDEARAAAHSLRLVPRLLALAFPSTTLPSAPSPSLPLVAPSSPSSATPPLVASPSVASAAALRCLRLLARGAPFLRSALVENAVVTLALQALPQALSSAATSDTAHLSALLALLANVLLDLAPAKRLFLDQGGAAPLSALLISTSPPLAPPSIVRSVLLVFRNIAHSADLPAKLLLFDALPFPHIATMARSPHPDVAEAALSLLRNLVHHDAPQVCIKLEPAELLTVASLPSHAQLPSLLLQALYVLCNIAAGSEDLRALLAAHEASLALLSQALASASAPVRVAALWTLYNLTWHHPGRSALCVSRGFAARLALLRADPVLDVRERACSITWL